jgi:hypothetical protein
LKEKILSLRLGKIPLYLSALMLLFFFIDLIAYNAGLYSSPLFRNYFNPTKERSLPTLISGLSFLLVAFLLFKSKKKLLGYFFVYLALDDLFMLHEQIGTLIGKATLKGKIVGYYWHYVFDPIYALFFLALFIFILRSSLKEKKWGALIFAVTGYAFIAVGEGIDFFEGVALAKKLAILKQKPVFHAMKDLEETLEVIGLSFIALSLIKLSSSEKDVIELSYRRGNQSS